MDPQIAVNVSQLLQATGVAVLIFVHSICYMARNTVHMTSCKVSHYGRIPNGGEVLANVPLISKSDL